MTILIIRNHKIYGLLEFVFFNFHVKNTIHYVKKANRALDKIERN